MNHVDEIEKCKTDFVYWAETYAHISLINQTNETPKLFGTPKLFDNQLRIVDLLCDLGDTDTGIEATQYRQSGTTTLINLFVLWRALFGTVSATKIVSINERKFGYVLKSCMFPIEFLPEWMVSHNKVVRHNRYGVWFANGSSITTRLEWDSKLPTFIHFDLFDFLPTTMKQRVVEWLKSENRPKHINFICSCTGIPFLNPISTDTLLKILMEL